MSELVFVNNGAVVTDSLTVAEVFGKDHKNVLRDIDTLECSEEFSRLNFEQSTYTNDRGREYPKYIISQNGFSFLVMGYTGKEAARFKEQYINQFESMKKQLQNPFFNYTPSQQLQAILMLDSRTQEIETRMERIENNTTIDHGQQRTLITAGSKVAITALGGKESAAYRNSSIRQQMYSALWGDYKDYFNVNAKANTLRKDFERALEFVAGWSVPGKLQREVEEMNNQIVM